MKTTIKLTTSKRITVEPCKKTGGVLLEIINSRDNGKVTSLEAFHLTADQAGVLVFGIECAEREG